MNEQRKEVRTRKSYLNCVGFRIGFEGKIRA